MRLMVGLHNLELGGSQLNALDLATAVRDRGHDVHAFATHQGTPGPVAELVRERGLPLTLARCSHQHTRRAAPCRPTVAQALTRAVADERIEVFHGYESEMILDALYGPFLRFGTTFVGTVYAMHVPTWLPRGTRLVAGTPQLVDDARAVGQHATLITPPVDTVLDSPGAVDGEAFRRDWGIGEDEIALVIVSRLEPDMKEEGVARTMSALQRLGDPRLRLVVVGTGPSFDGLSRRAAEVNAALQREAVIMHGPLADPRPAYAAADITLGMGGSGLRAMSFENPLIVLGIGGFSERFDEASAGHFLSVGLYDVGDGIGDPDPLADQISSLLDAGVRRRLGSWSRELVLEQFSLSAAAATLEGVYEQALADGSRSRVRTGARTAVHRLASEVTGEPVKRRVRPVVHAVLAQGK